MLLSDLERFSLYGDLIVRHCILDENIVSLYRDAILEMPVCRGSIEYSKHVLISRERLQPYSFPPINKIVKTHVGYLA